MLLSNDFSKDHPDPDEVTNDFLSSEVFKFYIKKRVLGDLEVGIRKLKFGGIRITYTWISR